MAAVRETVPACTPVTRPLPGSITTQLKTPEPVPVVLVTVTVVGFVKTQMANSSKFKLLRALLVVNPCQMIKAFAPTAFIVAVFVRTVEPSVIDTCWTLLIKAT